MKIRILATTLLFALASTAGMRAADEPDTPLATQMKKMNDAVKSLGAKGANLTDATKNEASLAAIAKIRAGAQEALKLEPKTKAEKPAADQAKFVADYQADMKKFIAELDKLSDALKAGKNEDAAKQFAAILAIQKEDHTLYRKSAKKN